MPVEFLGMGATNDGTETHPRSGPAFDPEYTVALAQSDLDLVQLEWPDDALYPLHWVALTYWTISLNSALPAPPSIS